MPFDPVAFATPPPPTPPPLEGRCSKAQTVFSCWTVSTLHALHSRKYTTWLVDTRNLPFFHTWSLHVAVFDHTLFWDTLWYDTLANRSANVTSLPEQLPTHDARDKAKPRKRETYSSVAKFMPFDSVTFAAFAFATSRAAPRTSSAVLLILKITKSLFCTVFVEEMGKLLMLHRIFK